VGRGQNAHVAFRLLRIDGNWQVVGFGAFTELLQCGRLNVCVADIHNEPEAFPEVVRALHNNVQSLDASGGYISLGGDLSFTAFKIESDQNFKLVVQNISPHAGRYAAAWPRRCDREPPYPNVMHVTAKILNVAESRSSMGTAQGVGKQRPRV
jgi:hypothetical protein